MRESNYPAISTSSHDRSYWNSFFAIQGLQTLHLQLKKRQAEIGTCRFVTSRTLREKVDARISSLQLLWRAKWKILSVLMCFFTAPVVTVCTQQCKETINYISARAIVFSLQANRGEIDHPQTETAGKHFFSQKPGLIPRQESTLRYWIMSSLKGPSRTSARMDLRGKCTKKAFTKSFALSTFSFFSFPPLL